ncbi:MAG: hypothetical protein ACOY82_05230 [Pseudomonadota bacterium]
MKRWCAILMLSTIALSGACATRQAQPLASGQYVFRQRYAEHPNMQGAVFDVKIDGNRIVVSSASEQGPFPKGVIEEGTLERHARSGEWIIVRDPADRQAEEVGGCSDGPTVVDLKDRVYWTC